MRLSNGLDFSIKQAKQHVLKPWHIMSLHRPDASTWAWTLDWFPFRKDCGKREFFKIFRHGDRNTKNTIIRLFWLGDFHFISQHFGTEQAVFKNGKFRTSF